MVKPESIQLRPEPEGSVPGEPSVLRPVLQIDGQLVQGLVVHIRQSPNQNVSFEQKALKGNIHFSYL
jgi:hypothetical protein